tara:strand:- start:257 stop:400 length:144 start_codon:yes stop_codon:yes gene_type:complete
MIRPYHLINKFLQISDFDASFFKLVICVTQKGGLSSKNPPFEELFKS